MPHLNLSPTASLAPVQRTISETISSIICAHSSGALCVRTVHPETCSSCGWTRLSLTTVGWDSGLWLLLLVGNKTVTSQPLPPLWLLFFFQVQPNPSLSHHLPNISTQMVKLKVYTAGRAPHSHWQIHPWGVSPQLVWLSFCRRETQKNR